MASSTRGLTFSSCGRVLLLQITVRTNGEPLPGNLTVSPLTGTAFSTIFDLEVSALASLVTAAQA